MTEESTANTLSDAEKKIVQQIEYYFGDVNFPKDRFLTEEANKDDGWVPIDTLLKFNRLKALSTDDAFIAATIKKSSSELVEVDEEKKRMRRRKDKPLPENRLEFWKQLKTRTIYVKGFPVDAALDELMEFFSKHGNVETLLMRRLKDDKRTFKGSVFLTFATRDLCQNFLNEESVKFKDVELIKMFESEYYKKKAEERRQNKVQKQKQNVAARAQQKAAKTSDETQPEAKSESKFKPGLVLHLSGFAEDNKIDRDAIKSLFQKFGEVDWIDFNRGDKEAFIRVKGEEKAAEQVLDKFKEASEGKAVIGEQPCESCVLTGEAETEYWRKTTEAKKQALDRKSQNKKNKPKGKRERHEKGGHKHRRDRGNEKEKKKEVKQDSAENGKVADSGVKRPRDGQDEEGEVKVKAAKVE